MKLNRDELRAKYGSLTGKYEGYVQMSAGRISTYFREATDLPVWEDLHRGAAGLFIFEAALYEPATKRSILIRQIDDGWTWSEAVVDWEKTDATDKETYYSVFDDHSRKEIRMIQLWEKEPDPISDGFECLVPIGVYFAGFEKKGGEA